MQVVKAFTSITPTKRAVAETGVGHLLADKTVWAKGGDAAESFAKKALTDWKEKVKHTYYDRRSTAAGRRPLSVMKAKVHMNYVNDFVDWLKTVDEVPADPVCRLAATLVQHRVLHWKHLESIDPESPQVQHPTQAALLRRATAQATRCARNERPMDQDRGLAGAQLSSSACSSTVDARHKSAIAVAGEMSQNMVAQAHEKWSMEIHQICGDVFGSAPKKTVQKLAAAGQDAEVTRLLEERARLLRVECKKGSVAQLPLGCTHGMPSPRTS